MILNLPVVRSRGARTLFLIAATITVVILLWANYLVVGERSLGLSPIFYFLFTRFDSPAAASMLLALIAAVFFTNRFPARALVRWIGDHCGILAASTAVVFSVGTLVVYRNHPLAMDEYAVLFQSKVFAAGHLTGRFPPNLLDWLIPPGFQNYFLDVSHVTGQVASSYWPSFSLLLTPFTWLGIPWACNPVISALSIIAIHRLTLLTFEDREAAGLAVLLTLASPVFFADGISYYSMSAHMLANTVYALLLARPSPRRAIAAGFVGSIALTLHNPVPHLLFAIPWLIWLIRRHGGVKLFAYACIGYLPLCLLLGVGWFLFVTHLEQEGTRVAAATAQIGGLSHDLRVFALPSSTVLLARLIGVAKVWLWAVPGMIVIAAAGAWKWRHNSVCRLLVASATVTLLGYLFVPLDQGHGWGYRYFHSAWMVLPILAAGAFAPVKTAPKASVFEDAPTQTFLVACAVTFLVAGVALRALQIHAFISADLDQLPAYHGTERRVVFVNTRGDFYGADLVQNDPWLRGTEIRMLSYSPKSDASVIRYYFPKYHVVYSDNHGTVWSAAPRPAVRPSSQR